MRYPLTFIKNQLFIKEYLDHFGARQPRGYFQIVLNNTDTSYKITVLYAVKQCEFMFSLPIGSMKYGADTLFIYQNCRSIFAIDSASVFVKDILKKSASLRQITGCVDIPIWEMTIYKDSTIIDKYAQSPFGKRSPTRNPKAEKIFTPD